MDIADDIAYSTYDLEDAFKADFLNPLDLLKPSDNKVDKIWQEIDGEAKNGFKKEDIRIVLFNVLIDTFRPNQKQNVERLNRKELKDPDAFADYLVLMSTYTYRDAVDLASNGYRRNRFTSELVNHHIHDIEVEFNEEYPVLSAVRLKPNTRFMVEVLKKYAYISIIESPPLKIPEYRGYGVVETIFKAIVNDKKEGYNLLPEDFRALYLRAKKKGQHVRLVVDFVSGMTDRYAIEFYNKLVSDVPQTIFSPL
jgi:dGTPase